MADKFTIGLVQMKCTTNADENLTRAIEKIREAAARGAQIIALHELFHGEYFCRTEDAELFNLAEPVPGPTTDKLAEIAKEKKVALVVSLFERRAPGVYHNSCAVLDADGSFLGKYRKMHIPDDPLYYEKFYFTPGDLGFQAWPTSMGKIGVCVCWDQWYPEAARLTTLKGAEILFYPTAIGWHPSEKAKYGYAQHSAWETMQRSHAIANGCFVVAVNRVGHEAPAGGEGIEFWGQSFIVAPSGEILAKAGVDCEEIIYADVEWKRVNEHRTHWPFLRDRRIDAYSGLEKRLLDEE
jgi:N-carbamoylputrescine amidase